MSDQERRAYEDMQRKLAAKKAAMRARDKDPRLGLNLPLVEQLNGRVAKHVAKAKADTARISLVTQDDGGLKVMIVDEIKPMTELNGLKALSHRIMFNDAKVLTLQTFGSQRLPDEALIEQIVLDRNSDMYEEMNEDIEASVRSRWELLTPEEQADLNELLGELKRKPREDVSSCMLILLFDIHLVVLRLISLVC
jgi:hypothetical protein